MLSTILPTAGELVDLGFESDAKPEFFSLEEGHDHGMKRLLPVLLLNRGGECRFPEGLGSCQERGEFATALCEWELLAKKGDYRAQFNLARMYFCKKGVSENFKARTNPLFSRF
jgi:TPR repeat protein